MTSGEHSFLHRFRTRWTAVQVAYQCSNRLRYGVCADRAVDSALDRTHIDRHRLTQQAAAGA
jgi:hypothetical protein